MKQIDKVIKSKYIYIAQIMLFLYILFLLWFRDSTTLFTFIWLSFGLLILIIPLLFLIIVIVSLIKITCNYKNVKNWIPLLTSILIVIIIFNFVDYRFDRKYVLYKKDRQKIVDKIIKEKITEEKYYIDSYKNSEQISYTNYVDIIRNDDKKVLIQFYYEGGIPDDGTNLAYSNMKEKDIKKNLNDVKSVENIGNNWYLIHLN